MFFPELCNRPLLSIPQIPQPRVYEGIPFIWGFGDVWGMLQGYVGAPLECVLLPPRFDLMMWCFDVVFWLADRLDMGVSKNSCTPKSSILIGFSIINHPFWDTPIFGNTHIIVWIRGSCPLLLGGRGFIYRTPMVSWPVRIFFSVSGVGSRLQGWRKWPMLLCCFFHYRASGHVDMSAMRVEPFAKGF